MTKINLALVDETPKDDEHKDYYSVNYHCQNCGHCGYVYIKKGQPRKSIAYKCTRCQCPP